MKKNLKLMAFVSLSIFSCPLFASYGIDIKLDNHKIATQSYTYLDNISGKYYIDVAPELKDGRTYVPISTISKFFGASVDWQSPKVTIMNENTKIILTLGENIAYKNNLPITLDSPPYIKDGRTLVPLRFISEIFGYDVIYKDNAVNISLPILNVDNSLIKTVRSTSSMTLEEYISTSTTNICIRRLFDSFASLLTNEVNAPESFGSNINIDIDSFYGIYKSYDFIDSNDNLFKQYEIYYEFSYGTKTGCYLLRDVSNNKWYSFSKEQLYHILDLEYLGSWINIAQ